MNTKSSQPLQHDIMKHEPNIINQNIGTQYDDDHHHSLFFDVREFWYIFKTYKWHVLGIVFISFLLGIYKTLPLPAEYKATTTLLIEPKINRLFVVGQNVGTQSGRKEYYGTQYEILRSKTLIKAVVERLRLWEHPVFQPHVNRRFNWRIWLPKPLNQAKNQSQLTDAKIELRKERIVQRVRNRLTIDPVKRSYLVKVSYTSLDPELSAQVANAVVEAYIDDSLEGRLRMTQKAAAWLTKRLEGVRKTLEASEKNLQKFREKAQLLSVKGVNNLAENKLSRISADLAEARKKRIIQENVYDQIQGLKKQITLGKLESIPAVLQDSLVQEFNADVARTERKFSELNKRYGPQHPKIIAVRSELQSAKANLQQQISKVIDSVTAEYKVNLTNEKQLQRALEKVKREIQGNNRKQYQLDVLEREVMSNKKLYELFLTRFKETDLAGEQEHTNARVIDPATVPKFAIGPNKKRLIFITTLTGLMLGMGLALLLAQFDNTVKSADDVVRRIGTNVVGTVPKLTFKMGKKQNKEQKLGSFLLHDDNIADQHDRFSFIEAIRSLRTGLLLSGFDHAHKVIVFTSAVPSEGKSGLSVNLAMALGQMDHKVLLIDADMRRPSIATFCSLSNDASGLSDLVAGTATASECLHAIENSSVRVIPSGKVPPNPLELLSSKRFEMVLAQLEKVYDYIIIDTAPVQAVSDALILSRYASAVMFVVKADSTPYQLSKSAIQRLLECNAPVLGVVLNQLVTKAQISGRYAGRYGGHGYYYQSESQSKNNNKIVT